MNPEPRLPLSADPDKQAEIIKAFAIGIPLRPAARLVGLHPNTLRRFIRNNPDFHDRLQQARADNRRQLILAVFNAAKTHWRAGAWLLDRPRLHRKWHLKLLPPQEQQSFLEKDPCFRQRFRQAHSDHKSEILARIRDAAKTSRQAAAWLRGHTPTPPNSNQNH